MTSAASRWVLASANPGKLREIHALTADSGLRIIAQSELGIESPEETGETFVENALIKARHAAKMSGLPAIADDSGLTVEALDGQPGVRSARYAGALADDDDNIAKLLAALAGRPLIERQARFHCVMVAFRHARDPVPLICHGEWTGEIAHERAGSGGFGYDPVFYDPHLKATAAQLPPETKNRVSHRAAALAELIGQLEGRGLIARVQTP